MQKKILILPFVLLLFNSSLLAQATFSFGVKGGVNFSTLMGEGAEGSDALIGPHAGGLVNYSSTNDEGFLKNALQAEILYSLQGAKSGDDKTTLSYINIPIMIQRYIASSGFYIETGPQLGFLISAKQKLNGTETDIKGESKTFDFSVNFGLGYKHNSGIGINARYGLGVTSVTSNGYDINNAVLSAGLFYVFGSNNSNY